MKKSITAVSVLVLLSVLLSACNLTTPAQTQVPIDQINTIAAQTVEALTTQMAPATEAPTNTPEPATATQEPTATLLVPTLNLSPVGLATNTLIPLPTSANASAECLKVFFLKDVTIPDNTTIAQNGEFTKTWQIQNSGSCTWTTAFYAMAVLNDPTSPTIHGDGYIYPKVNIAPGAIWEYSAKLIAPKENGTYTQYWKMVDDQGNEFGIGGSGGSGWYVKIKVTKNGEVTVDDLSLYSTVNAACDVDGNLSISGNVILSGDASAMDGNITTKYQWYLDNTAISSVSDKITFTTTASVPATAPTSTSISAGTHTITLKLLNSSVVPAGYGEYEIDFEDDCK